MNMSVARNLESVERVAYCRSTFSVPIKVCSFGSIISTTLHSGSMPFRWAATSTFTRSPFSACMEFRSATKIVSSSPSISTPFLPFERRVNTPVATVPRLGALYFPGATSIMFPSYSSSARRMATALSICGLSAPTACATCL